MYKLISNRFQTIRKYVGSQTDVRVMFAGPMGKPRSRLSASQWQSVDMEYTSNIPWNIRNDVR
eukprot:447052-Prorocentrum_minimum.AAC.1